MSQILKMAFELFFHLLGAAKQPQNGGWLKFCLNLEAQRPL